MGLLKGLLTVAGGILLGAAIIATITIVVASVSELSNILRKKGIEKGIVHELDRGNYNTRNCGLTLATDEGNIKVKAKKIGSDVREGMTIYA